jgi:hypothetical protein
MTQVAARGSVLPGNPGLRRAILEEGRYFCLIGIQFAFANAFGAAQWHPLLLACLESFGSPLRDQVPLNFCGHRKGHRDDLALDTGIDSNNKNASVFYVRKREEETIVSLSYYWPIRPGGEIYNAKPSKDLEERDPQH